ncbi:hypothetical protein D9M68_827680 [compost metagenome]
MAGIIGNIAPAIEAVGIAETVDLHRAKGRSDGEFAEARLQRLQQVFAQRRAGRDRQVRVVGNIGKAMDHGDFRIEEIAQEEILREPDAAQIFEALDGFGLAHRNPRVNARGSCDSLCDATRIPQDPTCWT